MRKNKLRIVQTFMIAISIVLFSCSDESNVTLESTDNEMTKEFKEMASSLNYSDLDVTVTQPEINERRANPIVEYIGDEEVEESHYFEITDNETGKVLHINSAQLVNDSDNHYINIVNIEDDEGFSVAYEVNFDRIDDESIEITSVNRLRRGRNSVGGQERRLNNDCFGSYSLNCIDDNNDGVVSYGECFTACIGYTFDTSEYSGQGIVVLGIAGGVGCVGCGYAAAFYVGIMGIACGGGCV